MQELTLSKQIEAQFHNERYSHREADLRAPLHRWYAAVDAGSRRQIELIKQYGRGKAVLEYGCADGRFALSEHSIARDASHYTGIDISDCAVARAGVLATSLELDHCAFQTMDAEDLAFPDAQFDLVFGRGIIHHLTIERALSEVRRVLRPGGVAVFYEPMGHNPLLNGFRRWTPQLRTAAEHPLHMSDFAMARRYFKGVALQFFGLSTLLAAALPEGRLRHGALRVCERLDAQLLRVPMIDRQAWFVLLTLSDSRPVAPRLTS